MHTVGTISSQLGLVGTIHRAVSFHPAQLNLNTINSIPVEFDPRLQTCGGKCHYQDGLRITLNPCLQQADLLSDLVDVFLHELAHALAHLVYGRKAHGHGESWWEAMHQLGQKPRRTHNIAACTKSSTFATKSLEDMGL